jgi:hypothetical protein
MLIAAALALGFSARSTDPHSPNADKIEAVLGAAIVRYNNRHKAAEASVEGQATLEDAHAVQGFAEGT